MKHKDSVAKKGKTSKACKNNYEEETSGRIAWRCESCGHIDYQTSEECPYCFYSENAFKKIKAMLNA